MGRLRPKLRPSGEEVDILVVALEVCSPKEDTLVVGFQFKAQSVAESWMDIELCAVVLVPPLN